MQYMEWTTSCCEYSIILTKPAHFQKCVVMRTPDYITVTYDCKQGKPKCQQLTLQRIQRLTFKVDVQNANALHRRHDKLAAIISELGGFFWQIKTSACHLLVLSKVFIWTENWFSSSKSLLLFVHLQHLKTQLQFLLWTQHPTTHAVYCNLMFHVCQLRVVVKQLVNDHIQIITGARVRQKRKNPVTVADSDAYTALR